MNALIIGCLVAVVLFMGRRLAVSRAENAQLLIHVAALKRQLARRDR
jgi:hypothetical protein